MCVLVLEPGTRFPQLLEIESQRQASPWPVASAQRVQQRKLSAKAALPQNSLQPPTSLKGPGQDLNEGQMKPQLQPEIRSVA